MIKQIEKFFIENSFKKSEARAEAEFLVCALSELTIEEIITGKKIQNIDKIWSLAEKRVKTGAPIQHITGFSYFMGDKFFVNSDVLIPRPETELLVRKSIEIIKNLTKPDCSSDTINRCNIKSETINILDIGTGSGCIAIEISKNLPEFDCINKSRSNKTTGAKKSFEIIGIDISTSALQIAIKNMEALGQERRVVFRKSDIFSSIYDNEKFDLIVSNPPYIPLFAKDCLQNEVKNFDPDIALFAKDENGVEFYEKILSGAKKHLKSGGYVIFELGCTNGIMQSNIVSKIAKDNGYILKFIEQDLSKIDRIIGFSIQ